MNDVCDTPELSRKASMLSRRDVNGKMKLVDGETGAEVDNDSSAANASSSSSSSSSAPAGPVEMVFCPGCGLRQQATQKYCNNCEADLKGDGKLNDTDMCQALEDGAGDGNNDEEEEEDELDDLPARRKSFGNNFLQIEKPIRAQKYSMSAPSPGKKDSSFDINASSPSPAPSAASEGGRAGRRVRWDEASILETKRMLRELRGIRGYVDSAASDSGYYMEELYRQEALEKLRGAPDGSFLIVDGELEKEGDAEFLLLCYCDKGQVKEARIEMAEKGDQIKLKGSKHAFESMSKLVTFFAGENDERPNMLMLSMDSGPEDGMDEPVYVKTKMVRQSHLEEPWYQAELSRAEAISLIEFEPSGSFVVRDDAENPGSFQLSCVKNGKLIHKSIALTEDQEVILEGTESTFESLSALISFFASEQSDNNGLPCRLRLPKRANTKAGGSSSGGSGSGSGSSNGKSGGRGDDEGGDKSGGGDRKASVYDEDGYQQVRGEEDYEGGSSGSSSLQRSPSTRQREQKAWLRLNMPKAQALEPIMDKPDGAFVIRSSESRPECNVLSYRFRGQILHELIIIHSGSNPGMFLDCAPGKSFRSLPELIMYYEQPRSELKYPLLPSAVAPTPSKLNRGGSRRSVRENSNNDRPSLPKRASQKNLPAPMTRGASNKNLPAPMTRGASNKNLPAPMTRAPSSKSLAKIGKSPSSKSLQRSPSRKVSRASSSAVVNLNVSRSSGERLDQRAAMSNWYCMNMTKDDAVARIPKGVEGAFVVRRSSETGFATISYQHKNEVLHAHIEDTGQGLHLQESTVYQPNLSALVAYYKIPTQEDLRCSLITW